ncbi:MAG TPA: hypothetical protein VEO74_14650, partial [Thermoanaerobaculia bacterium]|nr:hypothetical protein [Thermoanaerobaculia bacterium]
GGDVPPRSYELAAIAERTELRRGVDEPPACLGSMPTAHLAGAEILPNPREGFIVSKVVENAHEPEPDVARRIDIALVEKDAGPKDLRVRGPACVASRDEAGARLARRGFRFAPAFHLEKHGPAGVLDLPDFIDAVPRFTEETRGERQVGERRVEVAEVAERVRASLEGVRLQRRGKFGWRPGERCGHLDGGVVDGRRLLRGAVGERPARAEQVPDGCFAPDSGAHNPRRPIIADDLCEKGVEHPQLVGEETAEALVGACEEEVAALEEHVGCDDFPCKRLACRRHLDDESARRAHLAGADPQHVLPRIMRRLGERERRELVPPEEQLETGEEVDMRDEHRLLFSSLVS